MTYKIKTSLIMLFLLMLTSCSHIYGQEGLLKDREYDYLKAQSIPPVRVPKGYSSAQIQTTYPVTTPNYPIEAAKVNITPPGLYHY